VPKAHSGHGACNDCRMRSSLPWLLGVAGCSALGFALTSLAVTRGWASSFDRRFKRRVHKLRGSGSRDDWTRRAAWVTTPLGKPLGYLPVAAKVSRELFREGRREAAATVAGTAALAALVPLLLDRMMPHRPPPPERDEPGKQSYPSGHALQTAALAVAGGYVMYRERLGWRWMSALGLGSMAAGAGRLLLDRHWTSDVIGGYFIGTSLGALTSAAYEYQLTR
jgi:membrane-associated phospholipid phosphatase